MASRLRSNSGLRISFFSFQDIVTSVTGILILVTLILTLYLDQSPPVSAEDIDRQHKIARLSAQLAATIELSQRAQARLALLDLAPPIERLQSEIQTLQQQLTQFTNQHLQLQKIIGQHQREALQQAEESGLSELRDQLAQAHQKIQVQQRSNDALFLELRSCQTNLLRITNQLGQLQQTAHQMWLIPESTPGGKQPLLVTVSARGLTCERFNQPGGKLEFAAPQAETSFSSSLMRWNRDRDYVVFYVRPSGIELFRRCAELAKNQGFQIGFDALEEDRQILFQSQEQL